MTTLPAGERHFSRGYYYDRFLGRQAVRIQPGEYHVAANEGVITTTLGSCVSVCLHDPIRRVGGMNHFMLPGGANDDVDARYGSFAMELLLDHVLHLGGERTSLLAKVFGAGRVMDNMVDIGRRNSEFALDFLAARRIQIVAQDIGNRYSRKLCFFIDSGRVLVKRFVS